MNTKQTTIADSIASMMKYARENDGDAEGLKIAHVASRARQNFAEYLFDNYEASSSAMIFRSLAGEGIKTSDPAYKWLYNIINWARLVLVDEGKWSNESRKETAGRVPKYSADAHKVAKGEAVATPVVPTDRDDVKRDVNRTGASSSGKPVPVSIAGNARTKIVSFSLDSPAQVIADILHESMLNTQAKAIIQVWQRRIDEDERKVSDLSETKEAVARAAKMPTGGAAKRTKTPITENDKRNARKVVRKLAEAPAA